MLQRLGDRICAVFRATAPDPFVIAVLLTLVTLAAALSLTESSPSDLIAFWSSPSDGVWKFLGFSMQMCLILVTGHALAASGPVSAVLGRVADLPRSGRQAAALVAAVACGLGVINWGLGLIGGAILARDVGRSLERRSIRAHYPVLVAAGYMGLMVWHGGLSGTAPTKVTTEAEIADVLPEGVVMAPIPLDQTLFSGMNFVVTGGLVLIAALLLALLMPTGEKAQPASAFRPEPTTSAASESDDRSSFVRLLEDSPAINWLLALIIAFWAWGYYFPSQGTTGLLSLTPNTINLTMLMVGLLLHRSPCSYVAAVEDGARGCAGIILQFPLYAGIMGVMFASGLTGMLARGIADLAGPETLPALTCLSAGLINLFVPSGGGQWGVQGPIAVQTAIDAGVPLPKMVMAVAYGDQLTNMLQPFWALPLLAVTGAKARDIVGYTAIVMVAATLWTCLCLVIF